MNERCMGQCGGGSKVHGVTLRLRCMVDVTLRDAVWRLRMKEVARGRSLVCARALNNGGTVFCGGE